jgi:chlorosome envelope protein X
MGWDALVKFPETISLQWQRIVQGKLDPWQLFSDVLTAIGDALQLASEAMQSYFTPKSAIDDAGPERITATTAYGLPAFSGCCSKTNGKEIAPAPLELNERKGVVCN